MSIVFCTVPARAPAENARSTAIAWGRGSLQRGVYAAVGGGLYGLFEPHGTPALEAGYDEALSVRRTMSITVFFERPTLRAMKR